MSRMVSTASSSGGLSPTRRSPSQRRLGQAVKGNRSFRTQAQIRAGVGGGLEVARSASRDDTESREAGPVGIVVIAFLCTFMGAADGLSLGGLVFPADAEHPNTEFKHLGMCLGLLTALIANLLMALGSGFRFAVGGAIIPMVAVMADVFAEMGPSEPDTILAAVGAVTFFTGVLFLICGSGLFPVQEVLDYCPFVVFGGFLAGTGVLLLNFGFNLLVPEFTSVFDFGSTGICLLFTWSAGRLVLAPFLGAVAVFFIDRWGLAPSRMSTFILPLAMFLLAAGFYVVLAISGVTLEEARADGWLFATEIPKEIDFYKVWTQRDMSKVRWEKIFSVSFFSGVVKSFLIGLLTLTQNIFGTKKETGLDVNVDNELRLHGWISIIGGALGSLPGCIVMGFSCTAKKLGISSSSRAFPACLVFFSLLFFVFGSFIIAVTPKMVVGLLLIWLGFVFSCYWLYDAIGKVPIAEHLVVFVMTVVDVTMDSGVMIVIGLFASFLLTVKAMAAMPPCTRVQSLAMYCQVTGLGALPTKSRSDVRRLLPEFFMLEKFGNETLIITVRDTYFTTCAQLSKKLSPYLEERTIRTLVFDMSGQLSVGVHFLNTMAEFSSLSRSHDFSIILAAVHPDISRSFADFGAHLQKCSHEDCGNARFVCSVKPGRLYIIPAMKHSHSVPGVLPLASALELAEELTLLRHPVEKQPPGLLACRPAAVRAAIREAGIADDDPALSLTSMFVEDCCLNKDGEFNKEESFSMDAVHHLAQHFQIQTFVAGQQIFPTAESPLIPPLIMLVEGEVDHSYMEVAELSADDYHGKGFLGYGTPPRPARVEKLRVRAWERNVGEILGPLRTFENFQSETPHRYRVVAKLPTTCAMFRRESLADLMTWDAEAADLLLMWMGRCAKILNSELSWQRHTLEAAWHLEEDLNERKAHTSVRRILSLLDGTNDAPPKALGWLTAGSLETIGKLLTDDSSNACGMRDESESHKKRVYDLLLESPQFSKSLTENLTNSKR